MEGKKYFHVEVGYEDDGYTDGPDFATTEEARAYFSQERADVHPTKRKSIRLLETQDVLDDDGKIEDVRVLREIESDLA